MAKVVLLSKSPIPYSKIGSWTTMYHNYILNNHKIDYLICEEPYRRLENIDYLIVTNRLRDKINRKFFNKKHHNYFRALNTLFNKEESLIIQIVDNFGIIKDLEQYLNKVGKRNQCYIQFFYHGFPPFYENFYSRSFYEFIDEMVLLTRDSYDVHKSYYTVLPCRFSILHNGIDASKFYKISSLDKVELRKKMGFSDEKIFIWCSQDRPKKGLDFILSVWKQIYNESLNIKLIVVGATRENKYKGVTFYGKIPNNEMPCYYQISDVYLFPTLCHEGFGLSLIEALHSGCYCIASNLGGVSEVLGYGKYGQLITNPHIEDEWILAIQNFIENKNEIKFFPSELYTSLVWNKEMNLLIEKTKSRLE